jgi:cathepsin D
MDSISVNGAQAMGTSSAVIDTGTTLLVGDSSNVKQVIAMIPGAQSAPAAYGSRFYMDNFLFNVARLAV